MFAAAKVFFDLENGGGGDDDDDDDDDEHDEFGAVGDVDDDVFSGEAFDGFELAAAPAPNASSSSSSKIKSEDYFTGDGSHAATQRLVKDLSAIMEGWEFYFCFFFFSKKISFTTNLFQFFYLLIINLTCVLLF